MKRYLTDSEHVMHESSIALLPALGHPEMNLVKVYPALRYQQIVGFGAALTEAAGYVFAQMDTDAQERFIDMCFGPDGNRYSLCRLSIQSCDFSLAERAYAAAPGKTQGDGMPGFSIDDDWGYVLPLVKAAQKANPNLQFFASPWSPPAWAKTNRNMKYGGHLRRACYDAWAQIMARALSAYRDEGVEIGRISIQNEPQARQIWESCLYSSDQEARFLHEALKPALEEAGLGDIKVFIWDHNKEGVLDRTQDVLACPGCADDVDGVAFHWYSGDHFEAVRAVRDLIGPDRELIFTEGCDYYSNGTGYAELHHAEHYAHEIVGDLAAGANGIIDWNILLDENGGPNHVGNWCDAPIMHNMGTGVTDVHLPFHYLGHFSRFISPGAERVLATSYTGDLETCAFANPDGNCVLVVLNRTDRACPFDFVIAGSGKLGTRIAHIESPAHSIQTLVWRAPLVQGPKKHRP